MLIVVLLSLLSYCPAPGLAFNAELRRPWDLKQQRRRRPRLLLRRRILGSVGSRFPRRSEGDMTLLVLALASTSTKQTQENDDDNVDLPKELDKVDGAESSLESFGESAHSIPLAASLHQSTTAADVSGSGGVKFSDTPQFAVPPSFLDSSVDEKTPTVGNRLGTLFHLTRPSNFPSIVMLHMLGIKLALPDSLPASVYWTMVAATPSMYVVLAALLLTSSTSMIVNDYYDAKLGRDRNRMKPLVSGDLPLAVAKRFLGYLYAAALLSVAFLPGIPTRLSVVVGLMMTYWYTQYLKPVTWIKNVTCASLIALSPLTSGSAALHILYNKASWNWQVLGVPRLWRLIVMLFWGILGREILMDCNDVVNDLQANVQTVPVVYGRRFATLVALGATAIASALALSGPLARLIPYFLTPDVSTTMSLRAISKSALGSCRQLALATIGSYIQLRRGWKVYRTEGRDAEATDKAVVDGLISVLFYLASYI
jgi:4-hydroxybenzoate polyprenyltransferase